MQFFSKNSLFVWNFKLFLLLLLFLAGSISGQENSEAFDYIKLTAEITKSRTDNFFTSFWSIERGGAGEIEFPFYFGSIKAGLMHIQFYGRENKYPDFGSNYIFLGWDKELFLPFNFSIYAGGKTGSFLMNFQDKSLNAYERNESELAASIEGRLNLYLTKNFLIYFSAEHTAIFTQKKIEMFLVKAGISILIDSPYWLKEFLN
jgi:hypothetical protein